MLDRANVIEFNEVLFERQKMETLAQSPFRFERETLLDLLPLAGEEPFSSSKDFRTCMDECPEVVHGLSEMSDMLKEFNMHFGYRVINEVCRFARLAKSHVAPFDPITVLDIQVVQKILPKVHGTQARLEEPLGRMLEFAQASAGGDQAEQVRLPRTARKVSAMLRTLSVQGYADFIE